MGCTSSVQAPDQEDKPPAEGLTKGSKDGREDTAAIKSSPDLTAQSPRAQAAQLPVPAAAKVEDDEQDLYVPPLTPRKIREIEKWLESLPPPDVGVEAQPDETNSIKEEAFQGESAPKAEDSAEVDDKGSSLTIEQLNNHVKILNNKDKAPAASAQAQGAAPEEWKAGPNVSTQNLPDRAVS